MMAPAVQVAKCRQDGSSEPRPTTNVIVQHNSLPLLASHRITGSPPYKALAVTWKRPSSAEDLFFGSAVEMERERPLRNYSIP